MDIFLAFAEKRGNFLIRHFSSFPAVRRLVHVKDKDNIRNIPSVPLFSTFGAANREILGKFPFFPAETIAKPFPVLYIVEKLRKLNGRRDHVRNQSADGAGRRRHFPRPPGPGDPAGDDRRGAGTAGNHHRRTGVLRIGRGRARIRARYDFLAYRGRIHRIPDAAGRPVPLHFDPFPGAGKKADRAARLLLVGGTGAGPVRRGCVPAVSR